MTVQVNATTTTTYLLETLRKLNMWRYENENEKNEYLVLVLVVVVVLGVGARSRSRQKQTQLGTFTSLQFFSISTHFVAMKIANKKHEIGDWKSQITK